MSFTYGMVIFVTVACAGYGGILWLGRRRNWGVNRTATIESILLLTCSMATAVAWNAENSVPNTVTSTLLAPLVIGVFAYFQTAFIYARLEKFSSHGGGDETHHKPGKSQYDRERRKRSKRSKKSKSIL